MRVPCLFCFLLSLLCFLSSSLVRVTFVPAVRFLALLCLCSMLFRRFCSRGFFVFFGAGLYGVVWFSFHLWTVSVPLKLCSVPDIQLVVAVRRESAHSGRMRLGGGCRVVNDHATRSGWYSGQPVVHPPPPPDPRKRSLVYKRVVPLCRGCSLVALRP